jgi:hypothetical protein
MSQLKVEAVFQSPQQARQAREHLLRMEHGPMAARAAANARVEESVLTLCVENAQYDEARDALITAGAARVSVSGQQDPGWMSHNNGQITGAGVTPGAGDSEAGVDTLAPRRI